MSQRMTEVPFRLRSRAGILALLAGVLLAGCGTPALRTSGPDIAYLSDPDEKRTASASELYPLASGNVWKMQIAARRGVDPSLPAPSPINETIRVVGAKRVGASMGTLVLLSHQGKPWRSEVLKLSSRGLELLAFGEGSGPQLELDPPMVLIPAQASSGSYRDWRGTMRLQKQAFPATGFSRVSGIESLQTRVGRAATFRIDTILTMARGEQKIHFPAIRWLAPGVGPVRRGFAEQGDAQISELIGYTVR